MTPKIVPRPEHTISRRDIDPDALKVLYRLHQHEHIAYLVGGSVRDLLLGRRPKDFDIGTSAHPTQIKRLFRNCWIIGRRFRLAHVKFGTKTIEVATFRRQVPPGTEEEPPVIGDPLQGLPPADPDDQAETPAEVRPDAAPRARDLLIQRDNTFGTPEEDAFRRDFTINALFYDIGTFAIIDYVGGLDDLHARLIRSIGNPGERFLEDPVRMVRAVALSARLDFRIDPPILDAIARHRRQIALSAPARLLDEYYKILRSGAAERTFAGLAEVGLLQEISPELRPEEPLWRALRALDAYRAPFEAIPDTLTNPVLLGTLLMPTLESARRGRREPAADERRRPPEEGPVLGLLPIARRDVERLRQIASTQRRLLDLETSHRARRALMHRSSFREALTWLEIHGSVPQIVEHWRTLFDEFSRTEPAPPPDEPYRRRRRRRRRSFRPQAP